MPTSSQVLARTACSATDVVKIYGSGDTAVRALDGVNVEFSAGSFTAIMGPSGSGKSTLMHCLAGLDTVTHGSITVGGEEITGMDDRALTTLRRDRVGFVFQSFNLLPTLTAEQNILLPLELAGRRTDRALFDLLTGSLGISDRLRHRPSELSGGQQQRVAIARSLITRPQVVFADEPTGALDSRTGQSLLDYLRTSSRESGQSIVMVTHDPIAAAPTLAVWAALEPGADLETVTAELNRMIAAEPDLALGGSAPERAAVATALGSIITLATGLLAVAVIIAIVGIGNTLGLSVIERTRESALLRALGLHRRQLRLMLAVEAGLLGIVGAAIGVLAGIGYGWIGAASAFGEAGEAVVLDIPWLQLAMVLGLAVVAALVASVLAARRAAMATPTQALAEV